MLAPFPADQWELNEGDYRQDNRAFDHITSTGMVSHVGPRGLEPYVRNIRRRIRTGGRYVHHAIMTRHSRIPLDAEIGVAFNKRYVWPGFHWFTLGEHIRALEKNGFEVVRAINLAPNYAKTVAAWYERMMLNTSEIKQHLGEAGFRSWQIYLTGGSQGLLSGKGKVYRVYCRAV
jgi:cyclopropane fatty-acyl-phospholipid synthase-like methyltransferase